MKTPTPSQTEDKMTWKTGDVEFVKDPPARLKKSAAQKLADRLKRGGNN